MGYLVIFVCGLLVGGKWYELRDVLLARRVANLLKGQQKFAAQQQQMDVMLSEERGNEDVGRLVRRVFVRRRGRNLDD